MTAKKISAIDKTVQETHMWLNEISEELNQDDPQKAYHALRDVLFTVRDRIPVGEALDLASQLPVLIRGIYLEGYKPTNKSERYRDPNEFLQRINDELHQSGFKDPQKAAKAVFNVLSHHVSEGQIEQVKNLLPDEIRSQIA